MFISSIFVRNHDRIRKSLDNFDHTLEDYMPVLMSMAKIYWDRQNWEKVEKIFRESAEFCADHDVWKLNVAHVFFMQQNKYKEALRYYEEIVKKKGSRSVKIFLNKNKSFRVRFWT